MSSVASKPDPIQVNAFARNLILANAVDMRQQIQSTRYTSLNQQIQTQPRNVGLIKGFWVKAVAQLTNGSGVILGRTDLGPSNTFTQIQFNDLQNNTRIQTAGWHVAMVNTIKAKRPFGASMVAETGIDYPVNYGDNWSGQTSAPATINPAEVVTTTMWYWIPLAYSNQDLRGAVYANVVNATMQLNFTPNVNFCVAFGADATLAMYQGMSAGSTAAVTMDSLTITIYQNYLDQLPVGQNGGVILPLLDLATIYELKNTTFTALVANQDFPMQYANYRDFLSTLCIFVNTAASGARAGGEDVNYWSLQAANFTNIWKNEPALAALMVQNHIGIGMPPGVYYFGSREKPISTTQYGNQQLVLNPLIVGTGAYILVGYEDFAVVNTLSNAGSLAAS